MPRKLLIRTSDVPYHITNRSNNRELFYIPLEELWRICLECLTELKFQFKCEIHSFVLMSNHYHLLISTPECNIGPAMKYFHREVARKANRTTGRVNHFFGGRYKWSVIYQSHYYWNAVKYIFRNPVRAGICEQVQNYKYSSLNQSPEKWTWHMTDIFEDRNRPVELYQEWLNEPFLAEKEESIRKALRRREFEPPRNSENGRKETFDPTPYKKGTVTSDGLPNTNVKSNRANPVTSDDLLRGSDKIYL